MKVLEAVSKGFGLAGKNFGLMSVLLFFNLIISLISGAMIGFGVAITPASIPPGKAAAFLVMGIIFVILSMFLQGGILGTLNDSIKEGKGKLGKLFGYCAKYFGKLLGLGIVVTIFLTLAAVIVSIFIGLAVALKANILATTVFAAIAVVATVVGVYIMILVLFAPYLIVVNNEGVMDSIKKSMGMIKKGFGGVLALVVALVLISVAISAISGGILFLLDKAVNAPAAIDIVRAVVNAVINAYVGLVLMGSLLLYFLSKTTAAAPVTPAAQ